jgi:hypothetical protein
LRDVKPFGDSADVADFVECDKDLELAWFESIQRPSRSGERRQLESS